jgi:hypothetical protein
MECVVACPEGEAWVPPNDCTSCLGRCRRCADITLQCLDININYTLENVPIQEDYKREIADAFVAVRFKYPDQSNTFHDWTITEGNTVNFDEFFTIESMSRVDEIERRVLTTLVPEANSKVDLKVTSEEKEGTTVLEIGVSFKDLEPGDYNINLITKGSKNWISNSGDLYFFDDLPIGIRLTNPEKESPDDIASAKSNGETMNEIGDASNNVAVGAAIAASALGSSFALPFIKFL